MEGGLEKMVQLLLPLRLLLPRTIVGLGWQGGGGEDAKTEVIAGITAAGERGETGRGVKP